MGKLLPLKSWEAKDRYSADSLLATGVVQVEQFCAGFDGMIPLSIAGALGMQSPGASF